MAETDQEQLDYGNVTCVHGMNLGTSGGADFMCGECESGFTERVTCDTCDDVMWLQEGQRIVNCYPSVKRWKEARFFREQITEIRANDGHDQLDTQGDTRHDQAHQGRHARA